MPGKGERITDYFRHLSTHAVWEGVKHLWPTLLVGIPAGGAWLLTQWKYAATLVAGGVLGVTGLWLHRRQRRSEVPRVDPIASQYASVVEAAHLVSRQNSNQAGPRQVILSNRKTSLVEPDMSAFVVHRVKMRAMQDLHFLEFRFRVEEQAAPVRCLSELQIKAASPNSKVAYFPTDERPRSKGVLLFFLPHLRAGEEREVTLCYRWPGQCATLLLPAEQNRWSPAPGEGCEVYQWNFLESAERIPLVEQAFYAHPSVGTLAAEITGARLVDDGADTLLDREACPSIKEYGDTTGWSGFVYRLEGIAAADSREYSLLVRRTPPSAST